MFLEACLFWSVKYFAQGKKSDKVDFLNPDILSFPTVYNKSLSKFFLGRPKILQDYNSVNYSKTYDDMCEAYCFEINRPQG